MARHDLVSAFRLQARDDEASSFCLFNEKHYGNSAYLCQQSIEKTVKAVMVEHELVPQNVKALRHMPLVKLWDMMYREAEQMVSNASDEKTKILYEGLKELVKAGELIFQGPTSSAKTAWWKLSLDISLTPSDVDSIKKPIGDVVTSIVQMVDLFNHIKKLADGKRAKSMGMKQARNMIRNASTDLVECLNEFRRTNKISLDQLGIIVSRLNKMRDALLMIAQQQKIKPFLYSFIIMLFWTIEFFIPIFMITPHEDIGRYPLVVNGRNSIEWYEEKHYKLQDLENTIQKGRKELIRVMQPNIRRRPSRL